MDILLSQSKANGIANSALLHPYAVCAHENSFLFRPQSKADSVLKISSSAHNMYLTTKPFQPSGWLPQQRTVNYNVDTLPTKTLARFKTKHYLKKICLKCTHSSPLAFFVKLFCDRFLLRTTRCYKNQINHANMII